MKKLMIVLAFFLFTGATFSQALNKGNLIGLHLLTITPNPDVTFNQFMDFFMNEWIPKYEESFPGLKLKVIKGNRGENENRFGLLFMFDSEATRDKYWPKMDESTELAQQNFDKFRPTTDKLRKLGTWTSVHTDWVVQ